MVTETSLSTDTIEIKGTEYACPGMIVTASSATASSREREIGRTRLKGEILFFSIIPPSKTSEQYQYSNIQW
jgi:hypothetical protein